MGKKITEMTNEEREIAKQEGIIKFQADMISLKESSPERWKFIDSMPVTYQRTFLKAYTTRSMANGVRAKCLDCALFSKEEITNCTVLTCALFEFRPYQKKGVE